MKKNINYKFLARAWAWTWDLFQFQGGLIWSVQKNLVCCFYFPIRSFVFWNSWKCIYIQSLVLDCGNKQLSLLCSTHQIGRNKCASIGFRGNSAAVNKCRFMTMKIWIFDMKVSLLIVCVCTYVFEKCESSASYNSYYNEAVNRNQRLKSAITNELPKEGKFFDTMSECKWWSCFYQPAVITSWLVRLLVGWSLL